MAEKERNDANTGKSEGKQGHGKRILLRTFGCQANVRDSEFVMGILLERGFREAKDLKDADVIIFNSCSVRKHAEDRLFSNIAELKFLKKKRPGLVIGLMGCTAQSYKAGIIERAPLVDFVCGPGNEGDLPHIIKEFQEDGCQVIAVDKVNEPRPELFPAHRSAGFKAYVSIGEGCNNFCSYCIVPYVRGRERSREPSDIIREVRDLAERGFKEITLLGQNVNSYGQATKNKKRTTGFVGLLEALNRIEGIERIRFMTSHPKDASIELFKAMRDLDKVCEHLHLPLQSGSDRILELMNRGYTSTKYLRLVDSYRKIVPGGSITSDIVVGFPSEREADFKKSLNILKKVKFDSAYLFKYSPRPPARSAMLEDDVPDDIKKNRLDILLKVQCGISEANNAVMVGKTAEVLVDGKSEKNPEVLVGRSRENKNILFKDADHLAGDIVNIKIRSVTPYTLKGEIVCAR